MITTSKTRQINSENFVGLSNNLLQKVRGGGNSALPRPPKPSDKQPVPHFPRPK
jgi:hypothetical protein